MFRSRNVGLVLLSLFLGSTACTSYKQVGLDELSDHDKVRVTTTEEEREYLYHSFIEADSIKGRIRQDGRITRSIPLGEVAEVEAVGTNTVATTLTIIGVAAIAFLVALGVGLSGDEAF